MTDLKITLLGTSGAIPTSQRNLISNVIIRDNELFIFDTGESIQQSMMKNKVGMNRPTHIFISHMHGDHILGLLGLIQTMSLLLRDKPLFVYGPSGISRFLKSNIKPPSLTTLEQLLSNIGLWVSIPWIDAIENFIYISSNLEIK